jgi:beta-glucosidase
MSIDDLISKATVEELVSLLAGDDFWHTVAVPRLGIPQMRVTDGPAGARGTRFDGGRSINVPCGTALAATWDPALVGRVGELLGRETLAKGARVLLAPTVNLHRTPIGGRNFECMSEDPLLTSAIAVAYVRGVQSEGVACCIKHFVGNDTEFERMTIDSQIDERTLRELYLRPFEAAVRDAGVMAVMTSYNRINGSYAAGSPLVNDVLRGEWGFDGLVMSDWFGLHDTEGSLLAGVDLEMPGPTLHRGEKLLSAVRNGQVGADVLRTSAHRLLTVMARTGAFDAEGPEAEASRDDISADVALVRTAGAESMVLLRNESEVLPLRPAALRRVVVVGPNASIGQVMGGGSAHVTPTSVSHPLAAIAARLEASGTQVAYEPGCVIHRRLPEFDLQLCDDARIDYFADADDLDRPGVAPHSSTTTGTARLMWVSDPIGRGIANPGFGARVTATFTPPVSGSWQFSVESVQPARVLLDGEVLIDNVDAPVGGSFFGTGRSEVVAAADLVAGRSYRYSAELRHHPFGLTMSGLNLGLAAPVLGDPVDDAASAAADADLAIVVVGTNDDWESEGWDRTTLQLPGRQDELVHRVAAAAPRTVVVVNAGSPVTMPWLDEVDAVLMAWFPGQEMGNALVDVLTGDVEPQGRLPVTFPANLHDTPAFEHYPGANGVANYLERRLVGHRWYDTVGREPLFPFGYGLGYADVDIDRAELIDAHTVRVGVVNRSARAGVEVVQVYAHRLDRMALEPDEPDQWLVGFAKVRVGPGEHVDADVALAADAWRTWGADGWMPITGAVELRVGRSSRDVRHRLEVRR